MESDRPLCIDLFCGLFGWGETFAKEGWDVIGFDIMDMCRELKQPKPEHCQLVLQDVRTIDGRQFKGRAAVIVASPPCQEFASLGFPWHRLKISNAPAIEQWEHEGGTFSDPYEPKRPDLSLFRACFRIAEEAECPVIVENVKNAQKYVGPASWHFGSFYLWGDIPALMPNARAMGRKNAAPINPDGWSTPTNTGANSWFYGKRAHPRDPSLIEARKNTGGSWFAIAHNTASGKSQNPVTGEGTKVPGLNWSKRGEKAQGFNVTAAQRYREAIRQSGEPEPAWVKEFGLPGEPDPHAKTVDGRKGPGGDWFANGRQGQDACADGIKHGGDCFSDPSWPGKQGGVKQSGLSGPAWFDKGAASVSSRSDSRKAASAQIAKIPPDLAQWIARVFKP